MPLLSQLFTPAQFAGYLVLVLGVIAYLQKSDRRLKWMDALQNAAYFAHFLLLGNHAAMGSAALSGACSLTAIRVRSRKVAIFFIVANVVLGLCTFGAAYELLAVAGSCLVAWAMLTMGGVAMRLTIFLAPLCGLGNDVLSGSIGGTVLEIFIAASNGTTIVRLLREKRAPAAA
jgi:hypothetical protein